MNHRSLLLINFVWLGFHNLCKHLSRLLWDIDQVSSVKLCLFQCQCPCLFAYLLLQSSSCMLFSVSIMHLKRGWSQPLDLLKWYASLESSQRRANSWSCNTTVFLCWSFLARQGLTNDPIESGFLAYCSFPCFQCILCCARTPVCLLLLCVVPLSNSAWPALCRSCILRCPCQGPSPCRTPRAPGANESKRTDLWVSLPTYLFIAKCIENDYSTTALWYSFMKKWAAPFLE